MSGGTDWSDRSDRDLSRAWLVNGMLVVLARCAEDHDPESNVFERAHREIQAELLRRAKERSDETA